MLELSERFIAFFSLAEPNVRYVIIGGILFATGSALVGSFLFLRKKSLVGDAISHAILPGICAGFILAGTKNPFALMAGALLTGWLAQLFIDWIKRFSRIKEDTAIGIALTFFFGAGILMLTAIQNSGMAAQTGLDKYLFGSAASLVSKDTYIFGTVAVFIILLTTILFRHFTLLAFDEVFAITTGFNVKLLEIVLSSITVLAIVTGIQAVGVVLMAAMLITPAATARFWTGNLRMLLFLAVVISVVSTIGGAFISYLLPGMPTGPWIVTILTITTMISALIAPERGVVAKWYRYRMHKAKILHDNILKAMYKASERAAFPAGGLTIEQLRSEKDFELKPLIKGMKRLKKQGMLVDSGGRWQFTDEGLKRGKRITRLHRLWELYLAKFLNLPPDHVHEDAESIEHIITPEIEAQLEKELQYPERDPHDSIIPEKQNAH